MGENLRVSHHFDHFISDCSIGPCFEQSGSWLEGIECVFLLIGLDFCPDWFGRNLGIYWYDCFGSFVNWLGVCYVNWSISVCMISSCEEVGLWQWPMRGKCIGEASHLGPPNPKNMTERLQWLEEAELFGDEEEVVEVLKDLFLMQAPNNPDDEETLPPTGGVLTPMEVYVGPEVELISLGEHTPDLVHCRPFAGDGGKHSQLFLNKLVEKLRQFPDVSAMPTHTWIPKSLGRRYSKIASPVLDWWLAVADSPSSSIECEAATLFLNTFDYPVSRDERPPQNHRSSLSELPKEDQTIVAQQIRGRLQKLEAGFWFDVVDQALSDAKKAADSAAERRTRAAADDAGILLTRNQETCV